MNFKEPYFVVACIMGSMALLFMGFLTLATYHEKADTLVVLLFQIAIFIISGVFTYCISHFFANYTADKELKRFGKTAGRRLRSLFRNVIDIDDIIDLNDTPDVKIKLIINLTDYQISLIDDALDDWFDVMPELRAYLQNPSNLEGTRNAV